MKRSTRSFAKKASNLYQSIHRQLSVYAGAAVVAVVSVLALTQPSEAKIVYTKVHVVLTLEGTYNLDLKNDGVTDFTIEVYHHVSMFPPCRTSDGVLELPASGNGAEGAPPLALKSGALIGHNRQFYGGNGVMAYAQGGCQNHLHSGLWFDVPNAYLGLSFQLNGQTHYGWARLSVQYGGSRYQYFTSTLTGYAYETIAGKSIKAGQTKGPADELEEDDFGLKPQDAETLGGKPVADFVLRDQDIPASNAAATSSPGFCYPQNCLIQRCRVGSNNRLTGLCLEGVRAGVCRSGGYDPTHCPPGAKPKSPVSKQCGGLELVVDASRPCS